MSVSRAAKLHRIEQLRRQVPHVSASALSAILQATRTDAPELITRAALREARNNIVDQDSPYGKMFSEMTLTTKDGDPVKFDVLNPAAMLYVAFLQCPAWRSLMETTMARHPCDLETWQLILYCDEVTPGNQLSPDNQRKMWAFYFSFLELGAAVLSQEDAWFCIASLRSKKVALCQAGIAQAFKAIVKLLFVNEACSLQSTGVLFRRPDGTTVRFFCRLGMVLQDGGAHKMVWLMKGDAGTKACLLCRNLYTESSAILDEDGSNLLVAAVMKEDELDFATDEDIRGCVRRLAAHRATDTAAVFGTSQFFPTMC